MSDEQVVDQLEEQEEDVAEQMASRATKPKKKGAKKAIKGALNSKEAKKKGEASKARAAKGGVKKVGIIDTILEAMASENGASTKEILDKLQKKFPERDRDGMETTVRIQVTRLPKKFNFILKRTKDEKRGLVYKAPVSALKAAQKAAKSEAA
jgi:hypothetical protein